MCRVAPRVARVIARVVVSVQQNEPGAGVVGTVVADQFGSHLVTDLDIITSCPCTVQIKANLRLCQPGIGATIRQLVAADAGAAVRTRALMAVVAANSILVVFFGCFISMFPSCCCVHNRSAYITPAPECVKPSA